MPKVPGRKYKFVDKKKVSVEKTDRPKMSNWDKAQKGANTLKNIVDVAYKVGPVVNGVAHTLKYLMGNDPAWYCNYPQLTDAAEGLQFTIPNGQHDARSYWSTRFAMSDQVYTLRDRFSIPTVASVDVILTLGDFKNRENAINRIYNALRRVNTGSIPYTTLDIDEYILNYRLVLALHSIGRRAYGLTTQNSIYDVNKPVHYFAASGLDYDSFRDNAAILRSRLNIIADTMKIYAPYSLDLFKRTSWMFNNIFATSDGIKDQEYVFSLNKYQKNWDYTLNAATNVIVASENTASTTGMSFSVWLATLDGVVYAMTKNPINSVIAGDMAKAFGVSNMHYLPFTDEMYKTPVVLDKAALLQIWNAVLTGCIGNVAGKDEITVNSLGTMLQSTYYSEYRSEFYQQQNPLQYKNYLNFDFDAIKREDILESTRLQCWINADTGFITEFGSEIVTRVRTFQTNTLSNWIYNLFTAEIRDFCVLNLQNGAAEGGWLDIYTFFPRSFDYFPKFRLLYYYYQEGNVVGVDSDNKLVSGDGSSLFTSYFYNWSNWCEVNYEETAAINNVAMSSLYYVPLLVKETKDVLAVD